MSDPRSQPMNMRDMSMGQKLDIAAGLLSYPTLTILIFCRRRVGYRTIRPFQLVLMFLIMRALPALSVAPKCFLVNGCPAPPEPSAAFEWFTWAFLIWGFAQRFLRWRELASGKPWHSYSRGISYLEFLSRIPLPIPGFRRIPINFVYRYLDPLAVMCLAMLLGNFYAFQGLVQWWFFAAICMMFVELYIYDKQLDRQLDLLDAMVEGETHANLVQRFSGIPQGQGAAPGLSETAGIPTGIGPDIARQVEAHRAKAASIPGGIVSP
jgi:hypothetical protein